MRAGIHKDFDGHVFRVILNDEESKYLCGGLQTPDPKLQVSGSVRDGLLIWLDARGASIRKDLGARQLIAQVDVNKVGARDSDISPRGVEIRRVIEHGRPCLRMAPSLEFSKAPFNGLDLHTAQPDTARAQAHASAAAPRQPTVRPAATQPNPAADPARLAAASVQNAVHMAEQADQSPDATSYPRGLNPQRIDAAIQRVMKRVLPADAQPKRPTTTTTTATTAETEVAPRSSHDDRATFVRVHDESGYAADFSTVREQIRPAQPAPPPIVDRPVQPSPNRAEPTAATRPAAAPQPQPTAATTQAPPAEPVRPPVNNVPAVPIKGMPRPLTDAEVHDLRTGIEMVNEIMANPADIRLQVEGILVTHTLHMAVEMLNETISRLPPNSVSVYVKDNRVAAKRVKIVEEDL